MSQSFDDFARKHEADKGDRARLTKETPAEYEILKGFISQFAVDGKGFGSRTFHWTNTPTGRPMLVLGNVAAVLTGASNKGGVPQNAGVRFTRKPAGSGQVYIDDQPMEEKVWDLEPEIVEGEFVWFVFERAKRFSTADLAEEIAKRLAQCHIEYEKAFGREA